MNDGKRFKYCTQCGFQYLPTDTRCQMCGTPAKPKRTSVAEMLFNAITGVFANIYTDPLIRKTIVVVVIYVVLMLLWILIAL